MRGRPQFIRELGLNERRLDKCNELKDIAGHIIPVFGHFKCYIELNGIKTVQKIYVIGKSDKIFLSLTACKELKLIHETFPNQISSVCIGGSTDLPNLITTVDSSDQRLWPHA